MQQQPRPANPGLSLVERRGETGTTEIGTAEAQTVELPVAQATRWTWLESAVLAGYCAVVALGIIWHEPWADEAQAWLLARDHGWWPLMAHAIRYEGSPGLWHSLLWVLTRLQVSFTGMHWASGAIAAAGVFVLLRWSPFPLVLRILLPFGFWLAYQDAVVARSYVLFAVLAFPTAAILRAGVAHGLTKKRLLALAVLLGLMANLSVHGFVASLGFALVGWALLWRQRRAGAPLRAAAAALLLGCFWAMAIATTIPPSDVNFAAGSNIEKSKERVLASTGDAQAKAMVTIDSSPASDVRPGELAPVPPLEVHWTKAQALWHRVGRILSLLTYPVSNFRWLALAACVLAIAQAIVFGRRAGQIGWVGLLPWALMVLVFTSMYIAPRHCGMLWTAFVAALWLTWPADPAMAKGPLWLRRATLAALVLVALDQAWWTAHSVWADVHEPYSGDVAMAKFLKAQGSGKRVAGFYYHTVGVAAWFDHPVFFNQPHAYWLWSRNLRIDQQAPATIATHPDILVVGGFEWSRHNANISDDWVTPDFTEIHRTPMADAYRIIPYAEAHGYRETHRFCGRSFIRDGYAEELCEAALERAPSIAAPHHPKPR